MSGNKVKVNKIFCSRDLSRAGNISDSQYLLIESVGVWSGILDLERKNWWKFDLFFAKKSIGFWIKDYKSSELLKLCRLIPLLPWKLPVTEYLMRVDGIIKNWVRDVAKSCSVLRHRIKTYRKFYACLLYIILYKIVCMQMFFWTLHLGRFQVDFLST